MSEAAVFRGLREHILRPGDRFERVENGIAAGWPDVNYCLRPGAEGWIELKAPTEPAKADTRLLNSNGNHPMTIEQLNWMLSQHQAGGRVFLFVATKQRLLLLPAPKVIKLHLEVNNQTAQQLERISIWHTKVPVTDAQVWIALRGQLTNPTTQLGL